MNSPKAKKDKNSTGDIEIIVQEYSIKRPLYEEYTNRLTELFDSLLHSCNVETHLIERRTKELKSFKDKISRSSKKYLDPLNEVTDITGIRVIVYYEDDISEVCKLIEKEFEIDWENSSQNKPGKNPQEFGYQSIHYIIKLSESRRKLPEWQQFSKLKAEIQIPSVLQHSWAAISHKLQYKREADIPNSLKRKLFRLSALLEMADEEFTDIRDMTSTLTLDIEKRLSEGDKDVEINLVTLEEFLKKSSIVDTLVKDSVSYGFNSEDYEEETDPDSMSSLITLCNHVNIKSISQLDKILRSSQKWAGVYFKELMKKVGSDSKRERVWFVSPEFICVLILIKEFRASLDLNYLIEQEWDKGIANRVLSVADKYTGTDSEISDGK